MRAMLGACALAAAVVVGAAGCSSSGPTPPPLGSTSATASPTASSSAGQPAEKTSPAADRTPVAPKVTTADKVAAKTNLTAFLTGLNAAGAARTSDALKPLYQATCLWCADQTKSIDLATFLEGSRKGGTVSDVAVRYRGLGKQGQQVYDATLSVTPGRVVDDKGKTQLTTKGYTKSPFTFGIAKIDGRWQVVDGAPGKVTL